MPTRLSDIPDKPKQRIKTPSECPFPVFFMCPPTYVDNAVKNNPTMEEFNEPIDKDKFMAQWYNLYNVVAGNALVYLITPRKGLQDQTYVNSGSYLPHLKDRDVIVLSQFTAEGRDTEEDVAATLWKGLGYEIFDCPFKFEGEPELKWIPDAQTYLGGYGIRTDIRAHKWLAEKFGAKIIPIRETDEVLYHLDCSVFPIQKENVLLCTEIIDGSTVKQIAKIANVIPVSKQDCYEGICNSLQVESSIYNSSSLRYIKKGDKDYENAKNKDENLEAICSKLGLEITFFPLSEIEKSGGKLSCFFMHANYIF
jgi:N-dimethylarginine dimethylaminohydrolase